VLSRSQLAEATTSPSFYERGGIPGIDTNARLLAAPIDTATGELIVVVGSSLGDRNDALDGLTALFLIGGPICGAARLARRLSRGGGGAAPGRGDAAAGGGDLGSRPEERLPIPPARDQLRRLGLTLNEMLARIDATLERERRFVDDASHELRTR